MAEAKHTVFAMQALSLADKFRFAVGDKLVGKYRAEIAAPEGTSTGGGKQAVQPIKLIHTEQAGASLMVGSANQVSRTAELRSFAYVKSVNAQRGRAAAPIDFDEKAYNDLLQRIKNLLGTEGLDVTMAELPAAAPSPAPAAAPTPAAAKGAPVAGKSAPAPAAPGPAVTPSKLPVSPQMLVIGILVAVVLVLAIALLRRH